MNMMHKMVKALIADGQEITARAYGEDCVDYRGKDATKAINALEACDQMLLEVAEGDTALIVNERGYEHENVADFVTGGVIERIFDSLFVPKTA